ncbi:MULTISPECIES: carbohydrate porin [Pseudomonas]|jgi:porin|uniref:carbohydrate porin n=1 Tax=Pseudomonas TaxID=286 RepID=UPI0001FB9327|nr:MULTISPECIES: carbohydrate porin [Pseudomonas]MBA6123425.1 carbohydrate porin [Pseudomonas juntendi]MBH3371950.1 carbohydrate porin [Pseudomonas juntendi]MBI6916859.1 carbohydrate porin [Pseudomonas juntendi]MBS6038219.1 carbohydrate porin [Pseudomonas sp.]MCF3158781.1 carbohydrate porin [Pseudomonas juntendi]
MNKYKSFAGTPVRELSFKAVLTITAITGVLLSSVALGDDSAFKPHYVVTNQSLKNLDTGPRPHSFANAGAIFAGADLDLGKLLDNNLGTFHFEYTFFPWMRNEGVPTADKWQGAVGSALAGSVMHNDIDAGYLSLFAYSQNFLDDRLQITAGRTNAKRYFYVSNCGTIVACNDPLIEYTTGILPYPYGSWGGYAKYTVNDNMYVHGGVFESNPEDYLKKTKGVHWDPGNASGATSLAGVGLEQTIAQNPYPYRYELNAFHNSAEQIDISDGSKHRGSSGAIFRFSQTVARDDLSDPKSLGQAWQVFGAWSYNADNSQPFEHFLEAGVTRVGPFGRPQDSVSLKASYLRLSDKQVDFQNQQRFAATGLDQHMSKGESRVELNMHWQATKYLSFEPSVQYIFNPSNFYNPSAEVSGNGTVLGLQVVYDLGSQIGL